MKYSTFIFAVFLLLISACEKDAHIQLHESEQDLVFEGVIEENRAPTLVLTKSLDFFSKVDFTLLQKLFVHEAEVWVLDSTEGTKVKLVEKQLDTLFGSKFYRYEPENLQAFKGKRGHVYQLQVRIEDKEYKAITSIPSGGFHLNQIWSIPAERNGKVDSTRYFIVAEISDPPHLGDYARYFTKTNSEPFYPGMVSVASDEITNGRVFDFLMYKGVNKNQEIELEDYGFFNPGDSVVLKFCNIDKTTFDFWDSWENAWASSNNPFSSPIAVEGNIPHALGYWGGYQTQYKSIVIPE